MPEGLEGLLTPFYGTQNLKLGELLHREVLRTSQRGNQVEKVGENALRLKYYRKVQKILIRDESERFYCDLEVGTYFVQSLPTSTSQNTDSPTMRVFFCCR